MKQTIITKYLAPTNKSKARTKAITTSGLSVTIEWNWHGDIVENHRNALKALCKKFEWKGLFVNGALKDGSYVWVAIDGVHPTVIE